MRCAPMRRRAGLVLGICNGFRFLCESGLSRRSDAQRRPPLHLPSQTLRVERADTRFTKA